jgi:perosamine synthetase
MGKEVLAFEQELARKVGAAHGIAVNSCTAALHIALVAAGVRPGDSVLVPVYTFTASAGSILQAGARPVFSDIASSTLNLDWTDAERRAKGEVRAIMPVDMAGLPADYAQARALALRLGCPIVADAAHSLGAAENGKKVGTLADFTCFSFYANKNLTTAEGGMIVTDHAQGADDLRLLRLHGMSRDAWKRYGKGGSWYYEVDRHGFKYNMNDLSAAFGRAQLKRFAAMQKKRSQAAAWYDRFLADADEVIPAPRRKGTAHAWHLYIVRLKGRNADKRNDIITYLNKHGVGTSVHFIPLCIQPFWRAQFNLHEKDFPNAMEAYRGAISLPMHPHLTMKQCRYVVDTLKTALVKV